jgi:hypothetical protein
MKTPKRNLVSSLAFVVATALVGSSARAAESTPASSPPSAAMQKETKAAKPAPTWVMGNIIAVKHHTIAINTENGRMRTVRIGRKTEIVIDGQKASARELKAGAPVMVAYRGHARPWAVRIEVDERKPVKTASMKETATAPAAHSSAETAQAK